jgi:hypothetical protein
MRFQSAKVSQSKSDLMAFLKQYPYSKYSEEAKKILEEIDFKKAKSSDYSEAYENFLIEHPFGQYSDEAKKLLEQSRNWQQAKKLGEIALRMAQVPRMRVDKVMPGGAAKTYIGQGMMMLSHPDTLKQDMVAFEEQLKAGANPELIRISGFVSYEISRDGMGFTGPAKRAEVVPAERGGMTLFEYCKANNLHKAIDLMKKYRSGK